MRRALEKNAAERARLEAALDANIRERLLLDQIARLHSVEQRNTVKGEMETLTDTHRLNISAGRSPVDKKADPFLAHIRNPKNDRLHGKGYTLRSLATALEVSASMLSMNRRTHACPQTRADRVEALTGWPADRKHWPAGILT